MMDQHRFFWLDFISLSLSENKAQGLVWIKPMKVDDLLYSPFNRTHLILKGQGELLVILNLAFIQLSRPPDYCLTAVNYMSSTIPLIPFQSKFLLSRVTSDGLASVLSNGVWNLERYFHTRAIHIPFPGSILKHMCYQLAQEAEKGHG